MITSLYQLEPLLEAGRPTWQGEWLVFFFVAGSFAHGREQLKVPAGLVVTSKSVERSAETIGVDIAQQERQQIQRSSARCELNLPIPLASRFPSSMCR